MGNQDSLYRKVVTFRVRDSDLVDERPVSLPLLFARGETTGTAQVRKVDSKKGWGGNIGGNGAEIERESSFFIPG